MEIYELFITFVPKNMNKGMKIRIGLLIFALVAGLGTATAQRSHKRVQKDNLLQMESELMKKYTDSLALARLRADSLQLELTIADTPCSSRRSPSIRVRAIASCASIRRLTLWMPWLIARCCLMHVYLNRPDLVRIRSRISSRWGRLSQPSPSPRRIILTSWTRCSQGDRA